MAKAGFVYMPKYKGYVRTTLPEGASTFETQNMALQCANCGEQMLVGVYSKRVFDETKKNPYLICRSCHCKEAREERGMQNEK